MFIDILLIGQDDRVLYLPAKLMREIIHEKSNV